MPKLKNISKLELYPLSTVNHDLKDKKVDASKIYMVNYYCTNCGAVYKGVQTKGVKVPDVVDRICTSCECDSTMHKEM